MPAKLDLFAADLVDFAVPRCERLLDSLFESPVWLDGPIVERRVKWTDAALHRDSESFGARGIYIWGIENRPVYVGQTVKSFKKRFSRYIWEKKSQCNLAIGIGPTDDLQSAVAVELFRTNPRFRARITGSVRFANEGIAGMWFALFPVGDVRYIGAVENVLIGAVNNWNLSRGIAPLLNVLAREDAE